MSPKTRGLGGVTVVIGPNLDFKTGQSGGDVVRGMTTKVGTDERGVYSITVPPGKYTILYWKAGYTPQVDSVTCPGTMDSSISPDKSGQGLHKTLQF